MSPTRRRFLESFAVAGVAGAAGLQGAMPGRPPAPVRPARLRPGHTVGLVNPSGATYVEDELVLVEERIRALDLRPVRGDHVLDRHGYLAGADRDRAADVNRMFADPSVDAILAVRGGWGAARILPLLEFDTIASNPKVFMGYSDITALLLAIHARTGLVTFHGPVGTSPWNEFTLRWIREILFEGSAPTLENPVRPEDDLVRTGHRVWTITPGTARGPLLGGNLTVLTAIVGSGYLPEWEGAVLFLEDVGEEIYRVDRMLTQLSLAGILDAVAASVFGHCSDCEPGGGYGSLTLPEVLDHHLGGTGAPAWRGATIGHIEPKWTLPIGSRAEVDAVAGTVRLLEPAVR